MLFVGNDSITPEYMLSNDHFEGLYSVALFYKREFMELNINMNYMIYLKYVFVEESYGIQKKIFAHQSFALIIFNFMLKKRKQINVIFIIRNLTKWFMSRFTIF